MLAAGTAGRMHEHQVDLPELGQLAGSWGLGFERFETPDGLVIGHDGGTIGQVAFLRIVPEAGVAVALLTNGGKPVALYRDVVGHLLAELAGVHLPPMPVPPDDPAPFDAGRYLGAYSCEVGDITVTQEADGRVWVTETPKGVSLEVGEREQRFEVVRRGGDTLIRLEQEATARTSCMRSSVTTAPDARSTPTPGGRSAGPAPDRRVTARRGGSPPRRPWRASCPRRWRAGGTSSRSRWRW